MVSLATAFAGAHAGPSASKGDSATPNMSPSDFASSPLKKGTNDAMPRKVSLLRLFGEGTIGLVR